MWVDDTEQEANPEAFLKALLEGVYRAYIEFCDHLEVVVGPVLV